jgi:hypothetical protein
MQQLGAIAIKQAVYVLPDSPGAREDFEWLKAEIASDGGEASVFVADSVDAWSDDELIEEFRRARQEAYAALARDIEALLRRATTKNAKGARGTKGTTRAARDARADASAKANAQTAASHRALDGLRQRLAALEAIDFFGSAGRDRVVTLLQQLDAWLAAPAKSSADGSGSAGERKHAAAYADRLWVTRPRPGVDRMASAWLIRRFIDPKARFAFAADRDAVPRDGLPFDMFGVEFSHHGERCTFETLCQLFAIDHAAVARIATIVHDLDLKDDRFNAPEAAAIGALIDGLQLTHAADDDLLAQGMTLFESLYRAFDQSARHTGPRPVARRLERKDKGKRRPPRGSR